MPPYTFQFNFDIGEEVMDLVTNTKCKIVGTSYINGETLEGDIKFFHHDLHIIRYADGYKDARFSDDLEKVI